MSVVDTEISEGVGRITLNRPEQMNAITVELGRELFEAIETLGHDPDVNVVSVRGAGGNFCAGGDFAEVERLRADGPAGLRQLFENFRNACGAVATCPVPVVALVEGVAMAGGFEFIQAADLVLASDDARICDNHIRFGQVPGGGSTQRLARLVGRQQALGLLLSGDRLSGLDAYRLGLAYMSWPADEFRSRADEFVRALAARDRAAVITIKDLVHRGLSGSLEGGLDRELDAVVGHISGDAGANGVATFATRRQ